MAAATTLAGASVSIHTDDAVFEVTVAVFCKWDKHRSVALGFLLAAALTELASRSVALEHLSKKFWSKKGCGWADCRDCDPRQHGEQRMRLVSSLADLLRLEISA